MRAEHLLTLVRQVIDAERAGSGTPGVGFGVIADGELLTSGVGVTGADGQLVTGSTTFRLCSITKPMTSTLVMSLVDEGLLDLDAPIEHWLPALPLGEGLTLRHLLLHTSGLEGEWRGDLSGYGTLEALIADYGSLDHYAMPGAFWGYCNTGYWLAGRLVEIATGTSYEQALTERVLLPLGMDATTFSDPMAAPHAVRGRKTVPVGAYVFPRARVSSGGVVSSADDLLRFAALHLGGADLLPASRIAELRQPVVPGSLGEWQSLGWATTPDAQLIGHSGSYDGYATRLMLLPEHGVAVAVLTNSDAGGKVATAVREAVRREVLGALTPPREELAVTEADLERVTGDYVHPSVDRTRIRVEEGRLAVEMKGPKRDGTGWCKAWTPTEFTITDGSFTGTELQFLPGPDGVVRNLRIGQRLGRRLA
ncbi:serine hydrolase domain-containing protein [Kribbella sp. GL6]|uniref:serine hydrolase domain-containing protein n=1 Tax=Kribbella sp. GL6 TaxID=3419765 RepID=UPI003D07F167